MPQLPLTAPWSGLASRARSWSEQSQQVSRRNAMVACTTLAARRRDREDAEEYLAALASRRPARRESRG